LSNRIVRRGAREELLESRRFSTQAEARLALFDFVEGWYNPHRRPKPEHSSPEF
jgi:hypothetical protein